MRTTGDSRDETDTSDIIPSQGMPQKREACLTHRLECLSVVTQHQSTDRTQQMQLLPAPSLAQLCPRTPGERASCHRDEIQTRPLSMPTLLLAPGPPVIPVSHGHVIWDEVKPLKPPISVSPASLGQGLRGELSPLAAFTLVRARSPG